MLQAFELQLGEELSAYEVEFQVLREELSVTPPRRQADLSRLQEEKKTLKRQNLDLVEQLQNAQAQKHALESSNQVKKITVAVVNCCGSWCSCSIIDSQTKGDDNHFFNTVK